MPSRYGIRWRGRKTGELDKDKLPSEDYERHYLLDGPTKTQSSYPVVDADGYLRRRNVKLAWNLRGHAEAKKDKVARAAKRLGELFENNPIPDDAYEENMTELNVVTKTFSAYKYSSGDWISSEDDSEFFGEIRDRDRDDTENVYKVEQYDSDSGEFTGEIVEKSESSLSSWPGPQNASDIEGAARSMTFASDDEIDEVYSEWQDTINMTDSEMTEWSNHPCADTASKDPQAVRQRNKMLLGTPKSEWDSEHIEAAKRTISFIERMRGQRPENPSEGGVGTCPSEWAVSLLNWAYNPFESLPDGEPNPGQENSQTLDDAQIAFAASALQPREKELATEFNEHGIRKNTNEDGELISVDAVYEAMEPGPPEKRNGVRITADFLRNVANKDYSDSPPYLMDHSKDTLSQIGFVKDVWFNESTKKLMVMARAFNTGSQTHDEIINRLTHEPPTIKDGSVGFGDDYESERQDGEVVLTDGKIREFSTTPFPGGYDEGGLKTDYEDDNSSEAGVHVVAS